MLAIFLIIFLIVLLLSPVQMQYQLKKADKSTQKHKTKCHCDTKARKHTAILAKSFKKTLIEIGI